MSRGLDTNDDATAASFSIYSRLASTVDQSSVIVYDAQTKQALCNNFRIQTQYHQRFRSSSSSTSSIDNELAQLRSEISSLTYLIKQFSVQQDETQALARRAEARAAIIEHKLIDIQQHVIKIPALEGL